MDIRYSIHPDHMKSLDTEEMRKHFLIDRLFEKDKVNLVYSHIDRIIAGGVCPAETELKLAVTKELGVDTFLERREMGIINIGPGRNGLGGREGIPPGRKGVPLRRHGSERSGVQKRG